MNKREQAERIVEWQWRQRAVVEAGRGYAEKVAAAADEVRGAWNPPVPTAKALEGAVNAHALGTDTFDKLMSMADAAAALRWQALVALYAMQLDGVHA